MTFGQWSKTFKSKAQGAWQQCCQSPRPITLNRWKYLRLSKAASTMSIPELVPYGINVSADGIHPVLDIIAIHALNGHREKTWPMNNVNWLRDLLPLDTPNARKVGAIVPIHTVLLRWALRIFMITQDPWSLSYVRRKYWQKYSSCSIRSEVFLLKNNVRSKSSHYFIAHSWEGIVLKSVGWFEQAEV